MSDAGGPSLQDRVEALERELSRVRYCKKHGGPLPQNSALCKMCEITLRMIDQAVRYSVLEEKYLALQKEKGNG